MTHEPAWRRYTRFWGTNRAADIDEEFRFHLDEETERLIASGRSPEDARAEALRTFGDVSFFREYCRRADSQRDRHLKRRMRIDGLRLDVRHALRSIRRDKLLSTIVLASIGLSVGLNLAVFGLVDRLALAELPVSSPSRLVSIVSPIAGGGAESAFPKPVFRALLERVSEFSAASDGPK